MTKTDIEWCDYTLNVSIGCKHGCKYCYAEKMNHRFKFIKNWNKPEFFPEKINFKTPKIPKHRNNIAGAISPEKPIIFLVSMGDLFGEWQKKSDIQKVIDMAASKPDITFMSLTKNPDGGIGFIFPDNWIFGVTIEGDDQIIAHYRNVSFNKVIAKHKFISAEPLLGPYYDLFSFAKFCIIGAMTGKGAINPKKEWIKYQNPFLKMYYKSNILKHFDKEFWAEKLKNAYMPEIYNDFDFKQ